MTKINKTQLAALFSLHASGDADFLSHGLHTIKSVIRRGLVEIAPPDAFRLTGEGLLTVTAAMDGKLCAMASAQVLPLDKKIGRGYSVQAKAKDAEIWIYEEIGDYWGSGITAKQFVKDLQAMGDVENIILHLNSPGGQVFDGIAIYNALKQHKAKKKVCIDGLAASIASVIAMAGDEICIASNALMMIHKAWGVAVGNADDLRETANMLEKLDGSIVASYARTGKDSSELQKMLTAETWMSADEALTHGFVDSIVDAQELAARYDLGKYQFRNAPQPSKPDEEHIPSETRAKIAGIRVKAQKLHKERLAARR